MHKILSTLIVTLTSASLLMALPPDFKGDLSPNEKTSTSLNEFFTGQEMMVDAAQFFVSSNTEKNIGLFNVMDDNSIAMEDLKTIATDADGIFYDRTNDILYQLSRNANKINAYSNVSTTPTLSIISSTNFVNGREITVVGNKLIVAEDGSEANGQQNRLIVYTLSPGAITFDRAFDVDINLWGIQADFTTLYAVVDNSNQIAVFNDFFDQTGSSVTPDALVSIEGLVRTHGITYDPVDDIMLLTDIGDADSDTDGAFFVINDFTEAAADGMVTASELFRASGGASRLGNPVDIAFDKDRRRVYIAERANGGGRVLGFKLPVVTSSIAPVFNMPFPGASAIHLSDLDDMPDPCILSVDGGMVSLADGNTETTIAVDGSPDMLSFASTSDPVLEGFSFTYVVTDASGIILGIPPANMVDFDPAGEGTCFVYGLSYTGILNIAEKDDLFAEGLVISDECFALSSNRITVNRVPVQDVSGQLFISSNTQPLIGAFDILPDNTVVCDTIPSVATDADGIYYDRGKDVLYQLNRTDNVINAYSEVSTKPVLTATSTSDFINGREIAVVGDKLVVAQDANDANGQQNRLVVYNISPTAISFHRVYDVDINLWGIHADFQTIYAVVDNSNQVAVFNNFFVNQSGSLTPDALVTIDDMVRTHGITYDEDTDLMLLTDIGDASSDNDGALVGIPDFTTVSADGTVSADEQARARSGASRLGNPVDIALDKERGRVYVAERANGGGRILGFKTPNLTGGIAPVFNKLFPGASAVYLSTTTQTPVECEDVDGGTVALEAGGTQTTIVIDETPDPISFTSDVDAEAGGFSFTYVITDVNGNILGIPPSNTVDFEDAGIGTCFVYGLAYTGNLAIAVGDDLLQGDLAISDGCFDLSNNVLIVNRVEDNCDYVIGGTVSLASGGTETTIVIDDEADVLSFASSLDPMAGGFSFTYVITNDAGMILGIPPANEADFNPAGIGTCYVYGVSYTGMLNISMGDHLDDHTVISDACYAISENRLTINRVEDNCDYVHAGAITLAGGGTEATIEIDGEADVLTFNSDVDPLAGGFSFTYVVTNDAGIILGIPPGNMVDFEPAGPGICRVYGLAYTGTLNIAPGDDLLAHDLLLSDDCFDLTDHSLTITRIDPCAFADAGTIQLEIGGTETTIVIDENPDELSFVSNVDPMGAYTFTYVVTDAEGNILGIPSGNTVDFNGAGVGTCFVYGLAYTGHLAIEEGDNLLTEGLAISDDCFNLSGNRLTINRVPDNCAFVDGGSVSLPDGNTTTTIIIDESPDVISFASTVDPIVGGFSFTYVVTDASGIILGIPPANMVDFNPAGVGICYVYGLSYTGSLNIDLDDDLFADGLLISDDCFELSDNRITVNRVPVQDAVGQFYVSSNTQPVIGVFNILEDESILSSTIPSEADDAEGIYYDRANDVLYQLNRTDNVIDIYGDVSSAPVLVASSTSDFSNGREIAVSGTKLVVVQDGNAGNGDQNRLIVYDITPASITLDKIFDVSINLWGIHADDQNLFAVVDNSGDIAQFIDFFNQPAGALAPDVIVTIESMVRTHGITYDAARDLMVLTDVGDVDSATDGALIAIRNFTTVSADGTVADDEQARAFGGSSLLGNPVDLAFDSERNRVYVAERANAGGRVMGFKLPNLTGGIAPIYNKLFPGASAVFFTPTTIEEPDGFVSNEIENLRAHTHSNSGEVADVIVKNIYPVPALSQLNVSLFSDLEQQVSMNVFNANGKLVLQRNLAIFPGDNLNTFDVSHLPGGMYFIRIPGLNVSAKFVKASNN